MQLFDNANGREQSEYDLSQLENHRRIQLFQLLSLVGIAMLLTFGGVSFFRGALWLSLLLVGIGMIGVLNMVWLHVQRNYVGAAVVLASCVTFLNLVLVATGGVANTGLLWVYPTAAIVIFVTGYRAGFALSSLLLVSCVIVLFWPDNPWLTADYPSEVKIRFLATLVSLLIACLGSEMVHVHSRVRVQALHSRVQSAAITDTLTKLPNRRFVTEHCIRRGFFDRSFEGGTLILADVDRFKRINDEFGHDTGDHVLEKIAEYLDRTTRDEDVIARWGGEEFLILLPGVNLQQAWNRADEIREGLTLETFDDLSEPVTMSFGLVHIESGKSADKLLNQADKNLYEAKASGRNCVVG
ncbi:GGDEF domain-containing protein [Simiduia aestuariiviva]|uniref:diguanylate cyclase n=1 Tax=Simiduia aestuariiviva TaxID=1510459 RepID=A0A839UM55_9GAMM|nr:sensor domain-containing diguanylate cyclase [Simiduia aestuariiviva]MBB3167629.1 diguanylate cyclase (GGDEF)-like protein [Simiduia aestuariiviva]